MKRLVIVGGGTAGWMCAIALAARMPETEIVVVDPAAIGPIGVGESVTGVVQLFVMDSLHELSLGEFFRETEATLKLGIWFKEWHGPGTEYLGPIDAPHEKFVKAYPTAVEDFYALASADSIRLGEAQLYSQLMRRNTTDYVYDNQGLVSSRFAQASCQFDAPRFAAWLKRIAPQRKNITHIDDSLQSFAMDEQRQFVTSITTAGGKVVAGDFFLDCTGFRRALLQEAYHPRWIDYSPYIKVDRAIPCSVDYAADQLPPAYTTATAAPHGWMWQVPTRSRLGCGYLYSSRYVDDAAAVEEMRRRGLDPGDDPRVIHFQPGKFATQWEGNVCAVGLAGGFLEALEATTIHGMYVQMQLLSELYLPFYNREAGPSLAKRYNDLIQCAYDDYVDFIGFHYHTGRDDTEFWRDYQRPAAMTDANRWRREKWQHLYPTREDFVPMMTQRTMLSTGLTIWAPMLCAMGYLKPEAARQYLASVRTKDLARANVANYIRTREGILSRSVPHREALQYLCSL